MESQRQEVRGDVLIIGGGCAALVAALEARKSVDRVLVVCKRKAGRSGNTVVARAGFSACVPDENNPDTAEQHMRDTLASGAHVNDPALVRVLTTEAAERVMGLEQFGVKFMYSDGFLVRRRPPGHSMPRSFSTASAEAQNTRGLSITQPLLALARDRGIIILSDLPVHRLMVRDGVVYGAFATDAHSGAEIALLARSIILAAGGGGQIFANTNNTSEMTGDSYALALEAGVPLRDMEFVQFHPAVMSSPAHATVSSSVFSEGAVLRDCHGERFMPRYDPVNGDTATRDVMSVAIFREVQAGNGVRGGVYMDCSAVPESVLESKLPYLAQLLRAHSIDIAAQWMVVAPSTHFMMGGVWIDERCRTNVEGLFVAGEAAGGVHGANRLAANALTEAVVFGAKAGREAAVYARRADRRPEPPVIPMEVPRLRSGPLSLAEVKGKLRRTMWEHCSIIRTEAGLRQAQAEVQECLQALPKCRVATSANLGAYLELERMTLAAQAIVVSALERKESRGAHCRDDYPARDDVRWLGSTRVEKAGSSPLRVTFMPLVRAPQQLARDRPSQKILQRR